jgi:hypothetical protein
VTIRTRTKRPDAVLKRIITALGEYQKAHPQAEIEVYRQNSVSVRIRVLNSQFRGKSRAQREQELWAVLNNLPEETLAEISLVLLLTSEEMKNSFASAEFDAPIPSKL